MTTETSAELGSRASPIEPDSDGSEVSVHASANTISATQSVWDFINENGRSYHSYHQGSYPYPNDEQENERLELQYSILKLLFEGRSFFAPLADPKKILDIGTGTGVWPIDVANTFPDCEITGTDLSPIQPRWVPSNVKFLIDDAAEEDWLIEPDSYDYIHTRVLIGAFGDFRDVIRKSFRYLRPGGYMESQEIFSSLCCDDGTMANDNAFLEWNRIQEAAANAVGRPVCYANKLKRWYEEAGFVDVREVVYKLPVNPWPRDSHLKALGRMEEQALLMGIQAFSLALFYRGLNWTQEEIEVYLINVRKAISDRNVHAYHKVYVVWGRKPERITAPTAQRSDTAETTRPNEA